MRFCILLCLISVVCASCSTRYYMKRGAIINETGRFDKAASKYEKAYNKSKSKDIQNTAALRAGECYEKVNRLNEAYSWYKRAITANKELPDAYLKAAAVNMKKGDFEVASEYYDKYEHLFEDDQGKNGLYNVDVVKKNLAGKGRYIVELKKDLNSRYSDFGPVYYPGDTCIVYFASTRIVDAKKKRQKIDPVTGDGFSHIFVSEYTQEIKKTDKRGNIGVVRFKEPKWIKPMAFRDSLYSGKHEGAMCFGMDGNSLYFTSSRTIKGSHAGTRIYKATKSEGGENGEKKGWTQVALSGVCGDSVSVGHPALMADGSRMYFVTDQLSGGLGGKDIWYVESSGSGWGEAVNMGEPVNSEYDEMYPYVRDNGVLYFASDRPDGFGGFDLYKYEEQEGEKKLEHLPVPINSFADDFGIVFKPGEDAGLLTSSRSNRSDNIYGFCFIPQQLKVRLLAKNSITDQPIAKVEVTVVCDDGSTSFIETDSVGVATMDVQPQREYAFATENPRFLRGKGVVSTYREKGDRSYDLTIEMQPIEKPIVIPNIYFDVAKWNLRPDAQENLKELLTILEENPNITIELSAHTDMVGNDRANMILSENRARSVVDFLISKGIFWDRLEAKGYGETQPRQINEKDIRMFPFLKVGDVLSERFVRRLNGTQKEDAMQLNRRIEFKVLRTNYKPGPNSKINPNQLAPSAEDTQEIGKTRLKDLKSVQGHFFTLQLGVFKNIPTVINHFKVVFTEKVSQGVRYCTGIYDTRDEAVNAAADLKKQGIDSMIRECNK